MTSLLRPAGHPVVIAHRGASSSAPENTVPAFQAAWAAGADWIEADVQPTIDGVPVLLHDETVDRTTNGTGFVRELTAAAISVLDAGSWFGKDSPAGSGPFSGSRVPELREVLTALTGSRRLLLEIKGGHTAAQVQTVLDLIHQNGCDELVLVQSFEVSHLVHVRGLQPGRPVGLLIEKMADDALGDAVALCRALGATACNPSLEIVRARPELVAELHAADLACLVWTVDEAADWAFLLGARVDGIITNRPAELLRWLATRDREQPPGPGLTQPRSRL